MLHGLTHYFCQQLLEGIGAISKKQAKKASSKSSNYQDSATAPVDRSNDDEAAVQDEPEDDEVDFESNLSFNIFSGVDKVCELLLRTVCVNIPFSYVRLFVPYILVRRGSRPGSSVYVTLLNINARMLCELPTTRIVLLLSS